MSENKDNNQQETAMLGAAIATDKLAPAIERNTTDIHSVKNRIKDLIVLVSNLKGKSAARRFMLLFWFFCLGLFFYSYGDNFLKIELLKAQVIDGKENEVHLKKEIIRLVSNEKNYEKVVKSLTTQVVALNSINNQFTEQNNLVATMISNNKHMLMASKKGAMHMGGNNGLSAKQEFEAVLDELPLNAQCQWYTFAEAMQNHPKRTLRYLQSVSEEEDTQNALTTKGVTYDGRSTQTP